MRIPNPYFENIPYIGNLIMDYIIYELDYPLLFVCKTNDNKLYLCDCCDVYKEQRWLIAPISPDKLKQLFNNELTIREAFTKATDLCCVATWSKGDIHETYKVIRASQFESEDLPDEGEFLDADEGEHDEYMAQLINRILYSHQSFIDKIIKSFPENTSVAAPLVSIGYGSTDAKEYSNLRYYTDCNHTTGTTSISYNQNITGKYINLSQPDTIPHNRIYAETTDSCPLSLAS